MRCGLSRSATPMASAPFPAPVFAQPESLLWYYTMSSAPIQTFSLYFPPKAGTVGFAFSIRMCYDGPDNDLEEMRSFQPWKSSMKHSPISPSFPPRWNPVPRQKGWDILLNQTAFYPEGGGQPYDTGTLGRVPVLEVHQREGRVVHTCAALWRWAVRLRGRSTGPAALI